MSALVRDAPLGQIIRYLTKNRLLQYPEEKPDFECPLSYKEPDKVIPQNEHQVDAEEDEKEEAEEKPQIEREQIATPTEPTIEEDKEFVEPKPTEPVEEVETPPADEAVDLEQIPTADDHEIHAHHNGQFEPIRTVHTQRTTTGIERVSTRSGLQKSRTQADLEQQFSIASLAQGPSRPIVPERLEDGTILVDWYTTDDPDNPQNWSLSKKCFVAAQICMYTLAVYMASAIYSPSELGVMKQFGVNAQLASMGLSMYVLAYGLGPMLWSPLSEIPVIGRNPPYMVTFALYVILLVPTALAQNFAGLIVLRFLLGFFGSPCLATGGASLQDMFSLIKLPYVMSTWALAATCGPALGPIISGFSVVAENWRWSQWEMLWLAGPVWLTMFFFLPETSTQNILLRRARRLRKLTGDQRLKSQSEIDSANLDIGGIVFESLLRPIQMMLLDPAIAFTALYTALVYGIYYSFFEAFPLVYITGYGFNLGEMGLAFLSITVGVFIAIALYWSFNYWKMEPEIRAKGLGAPERRLIPAIFASFLCPIGLFMFGWTARPSIHWIVPTIGVMIFTVGVFIILQCIFLYLPLTYPQYAASLFAGNDFARSTLACGAIHFSRPLYGNLGIGRGCSLLGGLTAGCIGGVLYLYFQGHKLRARSRFSAK